MGGIVPFLMEVQLPRLGRVPWLFEFPETNVRTYVRGPSGDPGVWFFSLEAARLAAVVVARSTYRVPYFWSRMEVGRKGQIMRYSAQRRWPNPGVVTSRVEVEIGDQYPRRRTHRFRPLPHCPLDALRHLGWATLDGAGAAFAVAFASDPGSDPRGQPCASCRSPGAHGASDRPLVSGSRREGWLPVVRDLIGLQLDRFSSTPITESNSIPRSAKRTIR